ncbi:hypothetical protein [Actinomadura sp. WAC 06369]|uniref:hypothetical protein n=1 Tax=Actinomadura sp. WAC 06369 TaxID=2203193 RepID=UPI000F7AEAB4|nr:hypothetical protein [Actinomadura sp. WAC 06369]RSN64512.1 hypothetical protein DMH08_17540 [Actinomadura sp. WAC 06369]
MSYSDDELLDFDKSKLDHWDEGRARANLAGPHAVLYRNHLAIGKWIDQWLANGRPTPPAQEEFIKGYDRGVREVAAHLRQGDLLPGTQAIPNP